MDLQEGDSDEKAKRTARAQLQQRRHPEHRSGSISNVQNQVGNTNSQQSQIISQAAAEEVTKYGDLIEDLSRQLRAEAANVTDYEQCVGFLDVAATRDVSTSDGRSVARQMLEHIKTKCGGAPGVATVVASTLSVIASISALA